MSKFFIRRPIFAIVVSLIIVLLGLISLVSLPIAQYPQISPPTINLSASYTGANAETVNQTVAQVLENQLNGIEGMDYMSSTSSNNGSYSLSIVFDLDTDGNTASVNVQYSESREERAAERGAADGAVRSQVLRRYGAHGESVFAEEHI